MERFDLCHLGHLGHHQHPLFAILDMINDHDPAVQGEELEGDVEKLLRKPSPRLSLVRESSFLHSTSSPWSS